VLRARDGDIVSRGPVKSRCKKKCRFIKRKKGRTVMCPVENKVDRENQSKEAEEIKKRKRDK